MKAKQYNWGRCEGGKWHKVVYDKWYSCYEAYCNREIAFFEKSEKLRVTHPKSDVCKRCLKIMKGKR